MALKFFCQNCNREIVSKFLKIGEKAKCKHCNSETKIPSSAINIDEKEITPESSLLGKIEANKQPIEKEIQGSIMIRFKHEQTGLIKEAPTGFSWTTFFFGFFVPLFRGWLGYAAITLIAGLFTFGFSGIIFSFIINKQYIEHLMEIGYKPINDEDVAKLIKVGIQLAE